MVYVIWHHWENALLIHQIVDTDGDGVLNVVEFGGKAERTSMVTY